MPGARNKEAPASRRLQARVRIRSVRPLNRDVRSGHRRQREIRFQASTRCDRQRGRRFIVGDTRKKCQRVRDIQLS